MRIPRRAPAAITLMGALLLAIPAAGLAQTAPTVTYDQGVAQLLVRGGVPAMDTFALTSGVRDAAAGTLTLTYAAGDGAGTLEILTPDVAGTAQAAPRPPRGAAVTYRGVEGRSGARAECTITWVDLSATMVSGSFLCPREFVPKGTKAHYAVVGTFSARAADPEAGTTTSDPAPMPIYPAGTPVTIAGQTITVGAATDVASACVTGSAKRVDHGACNSKQLPLDSTWRVIAMTACVSIDGEVLRLWDRTGTSRTLYGGATDAVLPIGWPVNIVDPAVTTTGLRRVVNPGSCLDGHLVAGTQGPLVVWAPASGDAPVGWTLDAVALPPTAEAPGPAASGAPSSPAPGGDVPPAASVTYTGGAADVLSDGAQTISADDLVLTEGTYVSDGQGASVLHLAFGSASGTLVIDAPATDGSWTWEPGAGVANQGVSYTLGGLTVDAGATGCEVDVAPTDLGGVQGSYVCTVTGSGTASGAFIANP